MTSAGDYYKLSYLKESKIHAHEDLDAAKDDVADAESELAQIQAVLARGRERVNGCKRNAEDASNRVDAAQAALEKAEQKPFCRGGDVLNPVTGLKQGEKIQIGGYLEYLTAISNARDSMAGGNVKEALYAEKIAVDLFNKAENALSPHAQFLSLTPGNLETLQQIRKADFVDTKDIPSKDDDLLATLDHARVLYEDGILDDPQRLIGVVGRAILDPPRGPHDIAGDYLLMLHYSGGRGRDEILPDGVIPSILSEVLCEQIMSIKKCHDDIEGISRDVGNNRNEAAVLGEGGGIEEGPMLGSDDEGGDDQQSTFKMTDSGWKAIEKAIRRQISDKKEANVQELEVPSPSSAKIARYNPNAHFRFVSKDANASVDCVLDSLLNCKLRSRPTSYSKESPTQDRIPFVLRMYNNSGFDVNGDMIAMCGDMIHNEVRDEKNFVGWQKVPYPVNLDSSKTLCELRDNNGSNDPWDTNTVRKLYKGGKRSKEWFGNCIADAEHNLVWAADPRTATVHAFSIEDSHSRSSNLQLSFRSLEAKGMQSTNIFPTIARCGDTIIGATGTGRLSAWNVNGALADGSDKPTEPHIMTVDQNKNFRCGDLQYLGDSQLLVAPLRYDFNESDHSGTIRLFDVNAESVSGLFCGTVGEVSIGKQYCLQSHNSVFAMSNGVGVVFDARTCRPHIALHTGRKRSEQILGVPSSSNTLVAFTYGSQEDIKCWDLRNPGSHVYTMATGNTVVDHLFWHEDTSSLLASTTSSHVVSYGRYTAKYMYGDTMDSDEENEVYQDGYWPPRAVHNRFYFGSQWHCDCQHSHVLLQYPFQNGRGMHEKLGRLKCQ